MQPVLTHVSGLAGLFVFLNLLWGHAPLESALLTAAGAGLGVYLVLTLGYVGVHQVLTHMPANPSEGGESSPNDASDGTAEQSKTPSGSSSQSSQVRQPQAA